MCVVIQADVGSPETLSLPWAVALVPQHAVLLSGGRNLFWVPEVSAIEMQHWLAANAHGPGMSSVIFVVRYSAAHAYESAKAFVGGCNRQALANRSEEHTSELQSLMRNTYAVHC